MFEPWRFFIASRSLISRSVCVFLCAYACVCLFVSGFQKKLYCVVSQTLINWRESHVSAEMIYRPVRASHVCKALKRLYPTEKYFQTFDHGMLSYAIKIHRFARVERVEHLKTEFSCSGFHN